LAEGRQSSVGGVTCGRRPAVTGKKVVLTTHQTHRIATTLIVAVFIFLVAIILPKIVIPGVTARLATTQSLELILSLAAIALLGKGRFADYGFCLPHTDRPMGEALLRWIPVGLAAMAAGGIATAATLIVGAKGNPIVKQLTLPQIILFVWIFSSTIEEIFTRGFLQGHLAPAGAGSVRLLFFRIETRAFISAVFFALMHLSLLISGADLKTVIIVLLFTFSVGLLAGHQRAKTGSLIPAIAVHMLANIGGVVGGIIYMIVMVTSGGKPPGM
jgi:membrane protease YdiL (CAAX protease family)